MSAEGLGERGCCGLGRAFAPPVSRTPRLAGDSVVPGEQHGQGLGLVRVQGHVTRLPTASSGPAQSCEA